MIFTIGVVASFLIYLGIGLLVGRRVKTKSDYFVAGRRAPTLMITGSLVASYLSTVSFMGEVGFAYDGYPILMLVLTPLNAVGYLVGVVFFGRYLRRSEVLTVPEFFGKRFRSSGLQLTAGITVVIGVGAYLIAVTQGASLILTNLLGIPVWAALLLVWIGYTSFTFFSGSPGVLVTDTIMFFVFVIAGVAGLGYLIWAAGGPDAVTQNLSELAAKPDILHWHGVVSGPRAEMGSPAEALVWAVTMGIVWMTIVAVSPWQSSRYLMAKNEHVSIRAGLIAMSTVLFLYVFLMLGGASINVFNQAISPSETALIWSAQHILPAALGVVIVTGIAAAALSSASTFLSLIGFSVAHDIAPHLRRQQRPSDDQASVRTSRLIMLAVGVVVLGIAYVAPPAVLTIGYFAATLFAASWGPVAILSLYNDRITRRGAAAGMITGFVCAFILQALVELAGVAFPVWANPVLISFGASLIAILLGSLPERPDAEGVAFRRGLMRAPDSDRDPDQVRTTLRGMLIAPPVFALLIVLLLGLYYIPFTQLGSP